jgi:hypothetical protein
MDRILDNVNANTIFTNFTILPLTIYLNKKIFNETADNKDKVLLMTAFTGGMMLLSKVLITAINDLKNI